MQDLDQLIEDQFSKLEELKKELISKQDPRADYYSIIINSADIFKKQVKEQLLTGNNSFETLYNKIKDDV